MKEKNYNLYTKVLAGLICYAAAFCLLSDWYDTEWLELDLEFKKSDLVCIMASEDPKVYAEQSKRVDREIAARQNMILESQVWLAKISRYLWIIWLVYGDFLDRYWFTIKGRYQIDRTNIYMDVFHIWFSSLFRTYP